MVLFAFQTRRKTIHSPQALAVIVSVAAAIVTHMLFTAFRDNRTLWAIVASLKSLLPWAIREPHPLLDVYLSPFPFQVLLVMGLVFCARPRRKEIAVLLAFLSSFFPSLLFSWGGPGMRILFRIPTIIVSCIVASLGALWLYWKSVSILSLSRLPR